MADLEAEIVLVLDADGARQAERVTERIRENLEDAGDKLSEDLRGATRSARGLDDEATKVSREFDKTERSVSDTKRGLQDSLADTRRLVGESRQLRSRMRDVAGESGRVERSLNDIRIDRLTQDARRLDAELGDVTDEAVRLDRILNSIGDELTRAERTGLENELEEAIREANRLENALDGVNRRLVVGSAAADQLGDNLAQAGRRAQLGGLFGTLGAGAAGLGSAGGTAAATAAAIAAPFVAATGIIAPLALATGPAIEQASALNEQISQSEVIFGRAAPQIERFADSAEAFGQSRLDAITLTNRFGGLLGNLGFEEGEIATTSQDLVQLSSDIASFRDADTGEVGQALISGLSGETEPLKQLGIFLSDAEVRAKALELGLADTTAEVDRNARAQASLALILEQSSLAQGDFTRTSDGLANQTRITQAAIQNSLADFGEAVEPAIGELLGAFNDELLPAIQDFAEEAGPEFAEFITDVTPALIQFGEAAIAAAEGALEFLDGVAAVIEFAGGGAEAIINTTERLSNFGAGNGFNTDDNVARAGGFADADDAQAQLDRINEFNAIVNEANEVGVNIFDFTDGSSGPARTFFEENPDRLEDLEEAIDAAEGVRIAISQAGAAGDDFFGEIGGNSVPEARREIELLTESFGNLADAETDLEQFRRLAGGAFNEIADAIVSGQGGTIDPEFLRSLGLEPDEIAGVFDEIRSSAEAFAQGVSSQFDIIGEAVGALTDETTFDEFLANLDEQAAAYANFAQNISALQSQGLDDTARLLLEQGPGSELSRIVQEGSVGRDGALLELEARLELQQVRQADVDAAIAASALEVFVPTNFALDNTGLEELEERARNLGVDDPFELPISAVLSDEEIAEAQDQLAVLTESNPNIFLEIDDDTAIGDLISLQDQVDTLSETVATPTIDPETAAALGEINNVENELRIIDSQIANPTIDLNLGDSFDELSGFERRLAEATRDRTVRVNTVSTATFPTFGNSAPGDTGFEFGGISDRAGWYQLSERNHPEAILSSIAPVSKQIADLQAYQKRTGIPIIERAAEAQARTDHGTSISELKAELTSAIREVMGITVNVDNNGDMRRAFRLAQRQMRRDRDQVAAVRAGFVG